MPYIESKLAVLFSILALACATGCAAEAGGDDAIDAPSAQEPAAAETASPEETPAPSHRREEVRGVQLDLPAHSGPGEEGRAGLRRFAQPPQPCPQLTIVGEEAH